MASKSPRQGPLSAGGSVQLAPGHVGRPGSAQVVGGGREPFRRHVAPVPTRPERPPSAPAVATCCRLRRTAQMSRRQIGPLPTEARQKAYDHRRVQPQIGHSSIGALGVLMMVAKRFDACGRLAHVDERSNREQVIQAWPSVTACASHSVQVVLRATSCRAEHRPAQVRVRRPRQGRSDPPR